MVGAPPRPSEENDVNMNEAFEVLSNERRRIVLVHLLERQGPVPIAELVDSVATAESNGHLRVDELRNEIHVSLHHNHLPKLASSNLIDHDPERGRIAVKEAAHSVEPYLEFAEDDGRRA